MGMVAVPTNFRSNICVCIIPLLLLLLLVPFLLYLLPQLSSTPETTMPPVMPTPAPMPQPTEPYDCKSQGLWSFDKKGWCCQHYGVGCPTTPPPTPDVGPYDCNAGYHPCFHCLKQQWSPNKLSWCCTNMQKGCQSNTPA